MLDTRGLFLFYHHHRLNDNERLLKELQAAHVSLSRQNDCLRKNQESLQLQQDR